MTGTIRLPSPPREYGTTWANTYTRMLETQFQTMDSQLQDLELSKACAVDSLDDLKNARIDCGLTISSYRTTPGDGGGGIWMWREGDQSANVTADPESGLWAAPDSDDTGASGAWQRQFSGAVDARWFGAKFDDSANDTDALTGWLNNVMTSASRHGTLPSGTARITAALPTINVNGVRLESLGNAGLHSVAPGVGTGTIIKYTGVAGATMLTVAPVEGVSNQVLTGVQIRGVSFDCNALAAKGLVWKSVRYGFVDIAVHNATSIGFHVGCVDTLGEATDTQYNTFRYVGRQQDGSGASGISLVLECNAAATGNPSLNNFEYVDIVHTDALAIRHIGTDNNLFINVRTYRASGSATNSIEWQGGATAGAATRADQYIKLSTNVAAIAKGTGTYTVAAKRIRIWQLDVENGTPTPTVETGASVEGVAITTTPTVTAGSGTLTTASCTLRYIRDGYTVRYWAVVTVTTNGTGASYIQIPLPFAIGNNTGNFSVGTGRRTDTGVLLVGNGPQNDTNIYVTDYAGNYPATNGMAILIQGEYEAAQ